MGLFNPPPMKEWSTLQVGQPLTEKELEEVRIHIKAQTPEVKAKTARYLVRPTSIDNGLIKKTT